MEENQIREPFDLEGLKLAFYGMLFVVINIRIQGFDIVPDVVGYLMVVIGLSRIEHYDEDFSLAKKVAYLLTVISLINIYQAPAQTTTDSMGMMETTTSTVNFSAGLLGSDPLVATIMMILGCLSSLAFAYFLCSGMKKILVQVGNHELAKSCDDRWKLILFAEVGMLGGFLLTMAGIPFGAILALVFVIFTLVAQILFLVLVNHVYNGLHGQGTQEIEAFEGGEK